MERNDPREPVKARPHHHNPPHPPKNTAQNPLLPTYSTDCSDHRLRCNSLPLQGLQLLQHSSLSLNLLDLRILELLAARKAHLQVLYRADLLLQAANLLRVRIRRGLSLRGRSGLSGSGCSSRGCRWLSAGLAVVIGVVALLLLLPITVVVPRPATVPTVLGITRRAVRWRSQVAVGSVSITTSTALLLPVAFLLVFESGLGQVLTVSSDGTRNGALSGLSTRDLVPGTTKSIGANVRSAVADGMGSTALILPLEMERSAGAASTRRAVNANCLGRRLRLAKIFSGRWVRAGNGGQRILVRREARRRSRTPHDVVQLNHVLVVHEGAADVPELDAVVDTQPRGRGGSHDILAVGAPSADAWVAALDGADLAVALVKVVYVDLTSQVAKAGNQGEATSGREDDGVARGDREGVVGNAAVVEDGGFGRHVAIHDAELGRVGRPGDIVDRALLVQSDARVKGAVGGEQVHGGLAIVALVRLVNVRLRQHNQRSTQTVPLELNLVALEKGLLRDRAIEKGDVVNLDSGGLALEAVSPLAYKTLSVYIPCARERTRPRFGSCPERGQSR